MSLLHIYIYNIEFTFGSQCSPGHLAHRESAQSKMQNAKKKDEKKLRNAKCKLREIAQALHGVVLQVCDFTAVAHGAEPVTR